MKNYPLRLSKKDHKSLQKLAIEIGGSVNQQINLAIKEYIKNKGL